MGTQFTAYRHESKSRFSFFCAGVGDGFSLSKTLGDHMVLQRAPVSAVVWGFAPPGTKVTTTFGTQKIVSEADSNSTWRASLMPTAASGTAHTISFSASTGETATLSDGARSALALRLAQQSV